MRTKLFLSTIIIVLVTLLLSMLSVNLVFKHQFGHYLTQTYEAALNQLPTRLSNIYKSKNSWDRDALVELSYSLPMSTEVTLKDNQGNLITTLINPMNEMHAKYALGMGMNMGMTYNIQEWKTKTFTIPGPTGPLATATVRYPAIAQVYSPEDKAFTSAVYHSLIIAAGLALLIGVLLSFWTSHRLVSPLQRLTKAAYRIGQGHLDEKVPLSGTDEVGQLALAFNSMADSLKQQEDLRKQFIADIAHELRTPLTSIRSYIEAFQDGVLPPDADNLAALNEEIDRLVGLASDLKDLNVAEMGALKISHEPIDLEILIQKVIRNLNPLIQEKALVLTFEGPPQHAYIQGDERLLTRLFYNLIHNAYKYTEPGGQISIRLDLVEESAKITIQDTGIGISKADLPYIFERFYRTDKSRTRETGGTGIGLALVKQIINLHQGSISVVSELGKGTTFNITLPKRHSTL